MQATVHRFDAETGAGSVVTDTGVVLPFSAEAFATSRLRHLRPGQRLTVVLDGAGSASRVTSMRLETVAVVPAKPSRA